MKYYTELVKYFSKIDLKIAFNRLNINYYDRKNLGRWNIDYCPNIINTKVKLANEDNSGSTDQYIIN